MSSKFGIVKRPKRGSKADQIIRRLEDLEPQDEVDMDWPRNVAIVPVDGATEASEVRSHWYSVVREYTMWSIGTRLVQWPNGDHELMIWRKL